MSQNYMPPMNFGMVEEDLYRSGQPNELNFPFLEKLHLKTIVFLAAEDPSQALRNFADDHDIEVLHLGKAQASALTWAPLAEETVIEALNVVLNPEHYPLHVMCNLGSHRTGTLIGCLRKLQRWNLTSIFEEYRRHAMGKVRLLNEQFIEFFDTDLVRIPTQRPRWI
ncbi:tyrosine phosphatase [Capsaspora owczarzaki ATCC 30864]|nr:tyrosine phosphatase [Capsaspora owczarzaki ATCC 30864]|eukprot:XP_004348965.1 tyrosine phosphatase [Capsaspora owczarzaki ATCC 30864]